jgi:polyhydroxyalkanoate synthase
MGQRPEARSRCFTPLGGPRKMRAMVVESRMRLRRARRLLKVLSDRALHGVVNGLSLVLDGLQPFCDSLPKERVLRRGKVEVHRYLRPPLEELAIGTEILSPWVPKEPLPIPILLVPPLMVRPYVYDLRPEHSMVRHLVEQGFDVFVVDFGVPDREDRHVRLETYTLEYLPAAIRRVLEVAGTPALTLAGYCMGGLFGLMYAAATRDPAVRNVVTIGSPIDFSQLGILTELSRRWHGEVVALVQRVGNVPGILPQVGLKLTTPLRNLVRYADLLVNLHDEEYVRGFEAIHRWANDFIPYPRDAFTQFFSEVFAGNKLCHGQLSLGGKVVDLRHVNASVLAFSGREDNLAPRAATEAILKVVGSTDKTFLEVDGGHIGIVGGSSAREQVWQPMAEWLRPRSLWPDAARAGQTASDKASLSLASAAGAPAEARTLWPS